MLTRSHIAVAGHKKKRSVSNQLEAETGREYDITKIMIISSPVRSSISPANVSYFMLTIAFQTAAHESCCVIKVQIEIS